jgi:hypothetical protein
MRYCSPMRPHRLDRLARLTQGIALVGLGISEAACGGEPRVNAPHPDEQPHVNAPPMGHDADAGAASPAAPAGSGTGAATPPAAPNPMPPRTNSPGPMRKPGS